LAQAILAQAVCLGRHWPAALKLRASSFLLRLPSDQLAGPTQLVVIVMAALTNTVHVVRPPGPDLAAIRVAFERFGEVAAVELLSEEPPKVAVVFYDVRAAGQAVQALGLEYCNPGPQQGARTVRLAGDAKFDPEDFTGISGVQADVDEDGTYVLEFFDVRDAARYESGQVSRISAACCGNAAAEHAVVPPPGLDADTDILLPPGLGPSETIGCLEPPPWLSAPPGLDDDAEVTEGTKSEPVCCVTITGLPNKLLNEIMMEAIIQQAGFDREVKGFSLKSGKPCGKVTISFSCEMMAERCASHFTGCQWDSSGTEVTTEIVGMIGKEGKRSTAEWSAEFNVDLDVEAHPFGLYGEVFSEGMAAFQQMLETNMAAGGYVAWQHDQQEDGEQLQEEQFVEASVTGPASAATALVSGLSAEAAVFVPAATSPSQGMEMKVARVAGRKTPALRQKLVGVGSDTSTEVGESEGEDERERIPKMLAAIP